MGKTITINFTQGRKTVQQWKNLWLNEIGLFTAGYVDVECGIGSLVSEKMITAIEQGSSSLNYTEEVFEAVHMAKAEAEDIDYDCSFMVETTEG